jgi:hypothetical protein
MAAPAAKAKTQSGAMSLNMSPSLKDRADVYTNLPLRAGKCGVAFNHNRGK